MIPPRPIKKSPPRPPAVPEGWEKIQPNRLFDSVDEIQSYYPDSKIIKTWIKTQIGCEILIPKI